MQSSIGDNDDRDSAGSPEGSTDTELDGLGGGLEDPFVDGDADHDRENYDDNDENEEREEDEDQQDSQDDVTKTSSAPRPPTSHPSTADPLLSPAGLQRLQAQASIRPDILTAPVYDIIPTIAAPHATSINATIATPDLRWVFTGGADGYIRKFNWAETTTGKSMLTVAQKHPFVDSVVKAGVLLSYWENEDSTPKSASADNSGPSPVYSLAVQSDGLWLLSGTETGGINLQSVRHDEGKQIASLKQHTSAVSVLKLAKDEQSVLSGSWDKTVVDWDLNTGKSKRNFEGGGQQISSLEIRPLSSLPIPEAPTEPINVNGTMDSDSNEAPRANGISSESAVNGTSPPRDQAGAEAAPGSPADSLFNGNDNDSLFGDNENNDADALFGGTANEDVDFSKVTVNGMDTDVKPDSNGDIDMSHEDKPDEAPQAPVEGPAPSTPPKENGIPSQTMAEPTDTQMTNGINHPEPRPSTPPTTTATTAPSTEEPTSQPQDESTFLAASIDGSIRLWDKRQRLPAHKIPSPRNVPPWCMSACWSPSGNHIYAGRRNGTVEEFSIHKLPSSSSSSTTSSAPTNSSRSLKLPPDSGAVSAVHAMPNGRHLICASYDILRLYDLQQQQMFKHSTVPFLIIPGHRTGVVSQLYVDPSYRYLITTGGNRGWEGASTEVLLGYEIHVGK